MLKPNETSLKCKYQLIQIKITRKKNFATDRKSILSKMGLKFRKCKFNILCCEIWTLAVMKSITPFLSKQKWLLEIACFSFQISSRSSTLRIHIKTYLYSFVSIIYNLHYLFAVICKKYFLQLEQLIKLLVHL